ncbi:MAG: sodium:proton antiporter [Gammaproteobacteria bacterium]|nr:sodium:proton antiporter [Gammaproteobacteria bacterium]
MTLFKKTLLRLGGSLLCLIPLPLLAATGSEQNQLDLTASIYGIIALTVFVIGYALVIGEEFLHLRKSKPMLVAAGLIWVVVAIAYAAHGDTTTASAAVRHNILEFAELMLFLLAAMTYINTMEERNVFASLRSWLISSGFSLRTIFWITGALAFVISPIADNLTTALVMAAVVIAVGAGNSAFISVACINIVVAANAGGAFSPFGDITTLMVWQKGIIEFGQFFSLLTPSIVNWLVPAFLMSLAVPKIHPDPLQETITVKAGGYIVVGLFLFTIAITVAGHSFLHLPPALSMMTGLGLLKIYGYFIKRGEDELPQLSLETVNQAKALGLDQHYKPRQRRFDIFISMKRVEWDTLLFFYGVILCVGGLSTLGYLAILSDAIYNGLGATWANVLVGILSAIVDNIPVMFAVLTMQPDMSLGQWLLVTLTAGVGGSLLSIGSAAGVALMGQARGYYTFFAHLKWSWAIALGYAASILTHLYINSHLMEVPVIRG